MWPPTPSIPSLTVTVCPGGKYPGAWPSGGGGGVNVSLGLSSPGHSMCHAHGCLCLHAQQASFAGALPWYPSLKLSHVELGLVLSHVHVAWPILGPTTAPIHPGASVHC